MLLQSRGGLKTYMCYTVIYMLYVYVRGEEYCGILFYNDRPPYSRKINSDTTFRYLSAISENIKVYWHIFSLT